MWVGFAGTGIDVLGEKHESQGLVEIFLDGVTQGSVDTSLPIGTPRQTQVAIYSRHGLAAGAHTLLVIKRGGTYATIDGVRFDQPVSEVTAAP
jgi:alpha-galactosidase